MRISDWSSDVCSSDRTSGQRNIENRLDAQRSGKANFDSFAPKFGMLLEPADDVQVYANYSRSVELPGFSELKQTPPMGVPGFVDVGPQKAWTMEIGTRGRVGIASWDVTFYRSNLRSEMLQFALAPDVRSEEHTSELQSLMRISYAVFCLKKKNNTQHQHKEYSHIIF